MKRKYAPIGGKQRQQRLMESFTNLMVAGIQQIQLIHNRLGQQESLKLPLSERQTIEAALLSRNF